MNQHEWVYGCYAYYLENGYEPGNPEDGQWHECHWPIPGCLGGTKTILLLKEHHAVHGVLQSEEWQYPCIWGWERQYLSGHLLERFVEWRSNLSRLAGEATARTQGANLNMRQWTTEQRSLWRSAALSKMTPDERRKRAQHASHARTKEQVTEYARRGGIVGSKATNQQRWRCTVTGYTTTAGPLTRWQRARGIDPANRERVR